MKKFFRIASVVLSILLIVTSLTSVSVFASAVESIGKLTVGKGDAYDIDIGVDSAAEIYLDSSNCSVWDTNNKKAPGSWFVVNSSLAGVYKLPLPVMSSGKTLDKYIFRFAGCAASDWRFNKFEYDGSTYTKGDSINGVNAKNQHSFGNVADSSTGQTKDLYVITADITSYAKECYNAGKREFYIGVTNGSTTRVCAFTSPTGLATNGYSLDSRPYVYYTETDAGALELNSVELPAFSDDDLVFNFTNPINPESVTSTDFTVNDLLTGEAVDINENNIDVSAGQVTLKDMNWVAYGVYRVELSGISDIYSQNFADKYEGKFTISAAETTKRISSVTLYTLSKSSGDYTKTPKPDTINGKYAIYQIDISALSDACSDSYMVSQTKFNCWVRTTIASNNLKMYVVPTHSWNNDSGTDASYLVDINAAYGVDSNAISPVYTSADSQYSKAELDLTKFVNDALSNNKTSIAVAIIWNSTTHVLGPGNSYSSSFNPYMNSTLVEKTFDAISTYPEKCGMMSGIGENIELTLADTLDNTNRMGLYKVGDVSDKVNAEITSDGNKYTIDPVNDLDEGSEYVVKVDNKIIHRFSTGLAFNFKPIYFTGNQNVVSYDDSNKIETYSANSTVTAVAEATNGSQNPCSAMLIIALYNSDGSLEAVDATHGESYPVPSGETVLFTKSVTIAADASDTYIQAFVWDGLENLRPICADERIDQTNN